MATGHSTTGPQRDYHQGAGQIMPLSREGYVAGPANSSMAAVAQLFARLSQEIEEQKPPNCIHFIVNFLCKHYPEHLHGFASIWNMDPDLERERHEVVNFFKSHKISTAVAAHFTNAGYDTLDTLTTLSADQLVDVEAFNNVKWLPGHKVRLQQIFSEIPARVRAYRQAHPSETRQIVGQSQRPLSPLARRPEAPYGHRPASPRSIAPVHAAPTHALPSAPAGPREYVVGVSAPVRVGPQAALPAPMATAGIDVNHDGRANYMVTGVDMNRDGIPDVLQQPGMGMGMQLALPGAAGRGAPLGVPVPQQQRAPAAAHMVPGQAAHAPRRF